MKTSLKSTLLRATAASAALLALAATAEAQVPKFIRRCPLDSVVSGTVCMDKYEASAWRVPNPTTTNKALVARIQQGRATAAELTLRGATQLGINGDDYAPCTDGGQSCSDDIYAVSLPGVTPAQYLTWFQAQQACRNARKRLPSNAEWQAAVADSPDPGPDDGVSDCNTDPAGAAVATGSRSLCVSADGAFDMVGNLYEWVADWVPRSMSLCNGAWDGILSGSDDWQCLVGAEKTGEPGALLRGGGFFEGGTNAGPVSIIANIGPSFAYAGIGFRCAR